MAGTGRPALETRALREILRLEDESGTVRVMHVIDRLSKSQRVVVVVALGVALGITGTYLMSLASGITSGWYGYAPLTATLQAPDTGLPGWLQLIIWLALIGAWALASIRVLRPAAEDDTPA
jgi:hypothetical protein